MSTNWDWGIFQCPQDRIGVKIYVHIYGYIIQRSGKIYSKKGWKGFRIQGVLNFSLIGILSEISGILADNNIGIFSVSTFNTDYILVKEENFDRALKVLAFAGYNIV